MPRADREQGPGGEGRGRGRSGRRGRRGRGWPPAEEGGPAPRGRLVPLCLCFPRQCPPCRLSAQGVSLCPSPAEGWEGPAECWGSRASRTWPFSKPLLHRSPSPLNRTPLGSLCWHPKAKAQPPSRASLGVGTHRDPETSSRARNCAIGGGGQGQLLPPSGPGIQALGLRVGSQHVSLLSMPPLQARGRGTSPGAADVYTRTCTHTHAHARTEGPARARGATEAQLGPARHSPPSRAHPGLPSASWGQGTAGRRNAAFTSTGKGGEIN